MKEPYYGKELGLLCPYCDRPMQTTLRNGGWSVDCQHAHLFTFIETGEHPCKFDYYEWNSTLYPTEEEAIDAHVALREEE